MSVLSGSGEYLPSERAALIALALRDGAHLTTDDLMDRFGISRLAARRDFQRLQRVLPLDCESVPVRWGRGSLKRWYWVRDDE